MTVEAGRAVRLERDGHDSARVGEFHRVGEQVPDDLRQAIAVAAHGRHVRHSRHETDTLGVRGRPDHVHGGERDRLQVHSFHLEPQLPRRDS